MDTTDYLKIFNPYKINNLKRLGNNYDGGYIIHEPSLKNLDLLVTYGVGYNVEFEKAFNTYTNAPVLAFDPTMKDINVFKNKILKGRLLDAVKQLRWLFKWLRQEKNLAKYQINFIQEGISDKDIPSYKTFKTHIEEYQLANKKLLLKIDVDGAEFLVFKNIEIYNQLDNVIQLIIEFHDLDLKIKEVHDIIKKLFSYPYTYSYSWQQLW